MAQKLRREEMKMKGNKYNSPLGGASVKQHILIVMDGKAKKLKLPWHWPYPCG